VYPPSRKGRTLGDSYVFEWVGNELERRTDLRRIEARGTVRLALREAGLEPRTVTAEQMRVVLKRILPAALERRRVVDAEGLCIELAEGVLDLVTRSDARATESAYDIFRRLGGDGDPS
jgi:hypothetical protein